MTTVSTEWAVKLRPQTLEQMVGSEVNREIVKGWIENNNLPNSVIFYGRSGTGKALKNGTKVLTSNGYKPIEQLLMSDLIASTDGHFYQLNGIYPQGVKSCYKLTFSHNNIIYASGDHIWTISRDYGKTYHDETTEEILAKGYNYIEPRTGWVQHHVVLPPVEPLELLKADLPVDPYLLGCLIGDGCLTKTGFSFTSEDQFVIDKMNAILQRDWGMKLVMVKDNRGNFNGYHFGFIERQKQKREKSLLSTLDSLGMCVTAESKHIPEIYLRSSIAQRRALLAGLMDTDGYIDKKGMSDFTSVSKQLILDVKELVESLGIVNKVKFDIPNWYTFNGERKPAQPANCIAFYTQDILSTLPRKQEREFRKKDRQVRNNLRLLSIEKVEDAECTCISVQAPNHLFIAENRIPTHNTTISRIIPKLMDAELIELDAASHNGVDDARQLNEQAARLSLSGKHKIFLVDEAHMLSIGAFNALLKNIEEPNPMIHFLWCTTEYTKLPMTIRGRSRMLKFYSVPDEQLKEYAEAVLEHEGYSLKDEVINLIVRQAKGQVRDLLKLLQTACEANLNDLDKLKRFLAIPDTKGMRNFINAVLAPNPKAGIRIINSIDTDLLEWVIALQAHIYELLEDKYGVREINCGNDISTRQKIKSLEDKFTDKQFGALLTELNKINRNETAYAQLYALLFRGI